MSTTQSSPKHYGACNGWLLLHPCPVLIELKTLHIDLKTLFGDDTIFYLLHRSLPFSTRRPHKIHNDFSHGLHKNEGLRISPIESKYSTCIKLYQFKFYQPSEEIALNYLNRPFFIRRGQSQTAPQSDLITFNWCCCIEWKGSSNQFYLLSSAYIRAR